MKLDPSDAIEIARTFEATLAEVWALWTTKAGFESWWGPDGFRAEVHALELRPGGQLLYVMIADKAETIEFMQRQGMPTRTESRITFKEIVAHQRLAYTHVADFVPGVAAYDIETVVTFEQQGAKVKMTLRFGRMHDEIWTERAAAGWKMQLGHLAKQLVKRPSVHVSIDVPDLDAGVMFYGSVFGFVEIARPFPAMAILDANNLTVCIHAKPVGSKPSPGNVDVRHYERHWTPVHVDLHVHDFDGALAKVRAAGGLVETEYRDHGPRAAAFCSDPFGNGFCVIGPE